MVPNPHPHPNPNPNQGERKEEAEDACLVVARQVDKLKALSKQEKGKPARKTPGVEKLLRLLVPHYLPNPNPNP